MDSVEVPLVRAELGEAVEPVAKLRLDLAIRSLTEDRLGSPSQACIKPCVEGRRSLARRLIGRRRTIATLGIGHLRVGARGTSGWSVEVT